MEKRELQEKFRGTSILVVDDEKRHIASMIEILQRSGFKAEGAVGGKEALNLIAARHFDILLLDLLMPDVDGFQVLEHLAAHDIETLTIACSGTSSPQDAARAIRLGAFDFVAKPYTPERLFTTLKNAVESRQHREVLNTLVSSMVGLTGQLFFDKTARKLCEWFRVDGANIGEIVDGNRIRAISMFLDGQQVHDFAYPLQGTPCHRVVTSDICLFPTDVSGLFPEDRDLQTLKVQGYAGAPITDEQNHAIGILWVISRKPLQPPPQWKEVLNIIAAKASAEIQRARAESALRQSEEKYRLAMEATKDGLWDWDVISGHVYYSANWSHILGDEQIKNNYSTWEERIHPADRPYILESLNSHLAGKTASWKEEHRLRTADGAWIWVMGRGRVVTRDKEGHPIRMVGTMTDITEQKMTEEALKQAKDAHRKAEEKFSLILSSAAEGIYGVDRDGICTFANPACLQMLGYDREEQVIGRNMHQLIHHTKWDGTPNPPEECRIDKAFRLGQGTHVDDEVLCREDGSNFPVEYWSYPLRDDNGIAGAVVTFFDITDRKLAEVEREQLLLEMGERMNELRCMFEITEAVRKHARLDDILFDAIRLIPAGWQYPEHAKARIVLNRKEYIESPFEKTQWMLSSDIFLGHKKRGVVEVYYMMGFPEHDEGPFLKQERDLIDAIAKTLSETIERKQVEAELEHLATHDVLTDLYNRKKLEQRIAEELNRASRYNHGLSVMMLDLDHFKRVNDSYGHPAGDTVLRTFAGILKNSLRKTDFAARFGGEEFVVILPETPVADAVKLAERLRKKIAERAIPIAGERDVAITTSIGVANFPDNAQSWQDLMKVTDQALYRAKKEGRNCVVTAGNTEERAP